MVLRNIEKIELKLKHFRRETPVQVFPCTFSKIFQKTCFVEYSKTCVNLNEMKQTKVYSQNLYSGKPGIGLHFRAVTEIWAYIFTKTDFITDAFL